MKYILRVLFIFSAMLLLSGCISRRSGPVEQFENPEQLTETNSIVLTDPSGNFRLRAPKGFTINQDVDEDGARLLHLQGGKGDEAAITMFIEETGNSVAAAVGLMSTTENIVEVKREPVTVAGMHGMKMVVNLPQAKRENVPYYFLSAGEGKKTYIFSLPAGKPWAPFEDAINSFEVLK